MNMKFLFSLQKELLLDYFMRNYPLDEDNEPITIQQLADLYIDDFDLLDEYENINDIIYVVKFGSVYVYKKLP